MPLLVLLPSPKPSNCWRLSKVDEVSMLLARTKSCQTRRLQGEALSQNIEIRSIIDNLLLLVKLDSIRSP